jgi:hypothetical protein
LDSYTIPPLSSQFKAGITKIAVSIYMQSYRNVRDCDFVFDAVQFPMFSEIAKHDHYLHCVLDTMEMLLVVHKQRMLKYLRNFATLSKMAV